MFTFFCLRNSAYEMRRDTSSHLRFLSVAYPQVRSHQESHALLVWLAFLGGGADAILRRACVFFRSRTPSTFPSRKPRASCLACISGRRGGCDTSFHSCLSILQKKIDFLLDSFYTIYRLAFDYERYTNERNKGILPFDLEK